MRGASRITIIAGGLLVGAAWSAGRFKFGATGGVTTALAEITAVLLVVLAWRYRRDRLAVAALLIAGANFLIRSGRFSPGFSTEASILTVVIAIILCLLALTRDGPLRRPMTVIWLAIVGSGLWLGVHGGQLANESWTRFIENPTVAPVSLAGAGVLILIVFGIRRSAFEGSLVWVVAACAAALIPRHGPHPATLLFTAGQLALLVGFIEDTYRLAYHDELTALPGRRALDDALRNLTGTFTVAMADIDRFKRFNDRHGHDAGDQVLRMVADELAKTGGGGTAYRYGGEEFAIVFPKSAATDVRGDLEDLRRSIAERKFALRAADRPRTKPEKPKKKPRPARRVTVTVSIGIAGSNSRRPTPVAVLKAADNALYRAKRAGRNRVVAAGDRLPKRS